MFRVRAGLSWQSSNYGAILVAFPRVNAENHGIVTVSRVSSD